MVVLKVTVVALRSMTSREFAQELRAIASLITKQRLASRQPEDYRVWQENYWRYAQWYLPAIANVSTGSGT